MAVAVLVLEAVFLAAAFGFRTVVHAPEPARPSGLALGEGECHMLLALESSEC
jgi:hypothetical protein